MSEDESMFPEAVRPSDNIEELAEFLWQLADTGDLYWQNGGDAKLRQAAAALERMDREIKRLTPSRPSEELCGDLRIAAVALREAGYPTGANACIAAAVRLEYIPTPPSEDKP